MIVEVEVDRIRSGEFRLRDLDEAVVENLAKPVVVQPLGDGYELVFGLHRLETCKRLGWKKIPALVKQVSDEEALLMNVWCQFPSGILGSHARLLPQHAQGCPNLQKP